MRMLVLFALPVLAFFAGLAPGPSPVQQAHDATMHIAQHTASDTDLCSATAIGPHAILTASHCEMPSDELFIQEGDQDVQILGRLRDGQDHTIYLVSATFEHFADVDLSDVLPQGENIFLFGNPGNWHDIFRRGYVAGTYRRLFGPEEVLFDFPAFEGDSGAGIFNDKGRIVAVVTGREMQSDDEKGSICLAISFRLNFTDAQLAQARSFVPAQK